MGRKSKLTEAQWEEVKARRLRGESFGSLADAFGISKAAIIQRLGDRIVSVKDVANQIVSVRESLGKLPVSDQISSLSLAEELMATSRHAAGTAKFGMATAHRLAGIAHGIAQRIDDAEPLKSLDDLKAIATISRIQNDAAHVGLNLLAANKDRARDPDEVKTKTLAEFYGGAPDAEA